MKMHELTNPKFGFCVSAPYCRLAMTRDWPHVIYWKRG